MLPFKKNRELLRFATIFALAYGLLITPWHGWNERYADYYRNLGTWVFASWPGKQLVRFEKNAAPLRVNLNTSITVGNRSLVDAQGRFSAVVLQVDTRSLAWMPTALLAALILATPLPWRRKIRAMLVGLIAIHAYILLITGIWITNNADKVALITMNKWQKNSMEMLEYTFIEQLGLSFVIPVVIWAFVSFYGAALTRKSPGAGSDRG